MARTKPAVFRTKEEAHLYALEMGGLFPKRQFVPYCMGADGWLVAMLNDGQYIAMVGRKARKRLPAIPGGH